MRKTTIALFTACAGVAIACSSGGDDVAGPGAAAADAKSGGDTKTIVLKITGPKKADITYGLNADQSQANGAKLPWTKKMTSTEAMTIATVSAQNSGSGDIECEITVNGKVVKTNKSEGQYSIVTCTTDSL